MNAEQKLLPCPFCGGVAKHEHQAPGGTMSSGMEPHIQRIACDKCGVGLPWQHPKSEWGKQEKHDSALRESLTNRWNTRALQQRPSEEVEAAAKRMWQLVGFERGYPDWQAADESEKEPFLRMARAALGLD